MNLVEKEHEPLALLYTGGTINKVKKVYNTETGEVIATYNSVYLLEKPTKQKTSKKDQFGKHYIENKKIILDLVLNNKLNQYDLSILFILEQNLSWENSIISDLDTLQYLSINDLSKKYKLSRNSLSDSLNRLSCFGIIQFLPYKKKQKLIVLNPNIVYRGSKINKFFLELFDPFCFNRVCFEIKEYIKAEDHPSV